RVLLAHDSITSYLGALGDQLGVVTASGTGVITLAVGRHNVARVDGWGYIIGDAGSAFWLGRHGLDAVMRAHDGRGEPTVLSHTIGNDFDDIEAAYLELHADPLMVSRIAAYSATVTAAAEEGDHVSRDICVRAAHELAHSTVTGLRQTELTDADSPAGGLL
ncbi:ATPase, partial [Salmonella enterica subsp. enterica serovar Derby]